MWNDDVPDELAWETFDFVDPNNPHGELLSGWEVPKVDVVTMVLFLADSNVSTKRT